MLRTAQRIFKSFSRPERDIFLAAALLAVLALVFLGTRLFYSLTTVAPAEGGDYTEGIIGQPIAINPLIAGANEADRDLIELAFTDLMTLADKYEVSADHKTWTITLKPDLLWSDGKPLTTDDVIFTLETIQNPDTNSPLLASWQGVDTERVSAQQLQIKTRTPYAYFLDNLKTLKIVPQHIFETIPPANLRLSNYNLEPVGSGPYRFVRYEKQKDGFITAYHLESNPHYAPGKAFIPTFTVRFFKNFKDATYEFNQRGIDGIGNLDPLTLDSLKVSHKVVESGTPRYYAAFFNQGGNALLKEAAVREALIASADTHFIVQSIFNNHASVVDGPLLPTIEGYTPASSPVSTSTPEEILDAAGWKLNAETGVREKTINKKTTPLELTLTVPDIGFLVQTANIIKEEWSRLGARVSVEVNSPEEVSGTALKNRDYQIIFFGNILRGNADVYSFWHSSQKFQPGLNLSLYDNKSVDGLLETVRKEFDLIKRQEALVKLQNQIRADMPALFLYSPNYIYATTKDLGGFEQDSILNSSKRFENVAQWYLATTRKFK